MMKKRILLLVTLLAFCLAGCGEDAGSDSDKDNTKEEKPTEKEEDTGKDDEGGKEEGGSETEENVTGLPSFTVYSNSMSTEETLELDSGSTPYGTVVYPRISMAGGSKAYPALDAALDVYSETVHDEALRNLADMAGIFSESPDLVEDAYNGSSQSAYMTVSRSDENVLSLQVICDAFSSGAAHPVSWFEHVNFDAQTGAELELDDVITDMDALPDLIFDNLESVADPDYVFSEENEEYESVMDSIDFLIEQDALSWCLTDTGICFDFDPYALMYYAFGPITAELTYEDYPELFSEKYGPTDAMLSTSGRVNYQDGEESEFAWEDISEIYYENMYEPANLVTSWTVTAPEWTMEAWSRDGAPAGEKSPWDFKEVDKSDLMYADDWAADHGFELPECAFAEGESSVSDGFYVYDFSNQADEHDYFSVNVTDIEAGEEYFFDLGSFIFTPERGTYFTEPSIRNAVMSDGVLYAEICHCTYAADQPYTGYIVAVDASTGEVLWRSAMQVANGNNFIVGEDTIICGYGFTEEDDYIYVLSTKSGEVLKKIKVKNAPDYFIPADDSLYVLCYDVAYEYNVVDAE